MCKVVTDGYNAGATLLANNFIDRYMCDATELNLKVYLYLLRHSHDEISLHDMGRVLDFTPNSIIKALKYWQGLSLIDYAVNSDGELSELTIYDVNTVTMMNRNNEACGEADKQLNKSKSQSETSSASFREEKKASASAGDTVAAILESGSIPNFKMGDPNDESWLKLYEDETFREKLVVADSSDVDSLAFVLDHELTQPELDFIAFLYDKDNGCGFDHELIIYLFRYCISAKHKQYCKARKYYLAIALDWYERGIRSIFDILIPEIEAHLGVPFNTTRNKREAINWVTHHKINIDVILYACDKAAMLDKDRIKNLSGKMKHYIEDHVYTMEDVKAREKKMSEQSQVSYIKATSKNSFNNFEQRSVSKEEDIALEKALINRDITQEKLDSFHARLKEAGAAAKNRPANW